MSSHEGKGFATETWIKALGSTAFISIVPFLILPFIPLDDSIESKPYLKYFLSFAAGALLGDAFLHLIPHAHSAQQAIYESQNELIGGGHSHDNHHHNHGHSHHEHNHHGHSHGGDSGGHSHGHDNTVGFYILLGILTFLTVEKLVKIFKDSAHSHSHGGVKKTKGKKKAKDSDDESEELVKKDGDEKKNQQLSQEIKVSGYLNLVADFVHNFTDGLSIGASYLAGTNVGFITTLTICAHEIPHEIGDFAILLQSGCSRKKAMYCQLVTALGALLGTVISLTVDGMYNTASTWILPFTAGGFIYIAAVSVIPELLEKTTLKQSIIEIICLVFGVTFMYVFAQYE